MDEMRGHLIRLGVGLVIVVPLLVGAIRLLRYREPVVAFSGLGVFLVAAAILGVLLTGLLSEFTGFLFYSGKKFDKAPPMYSIPESKLKKGLYEEALQLYAEIAAKYPEEIRPQIEMLNIAGFHLRDPQRAAQIYQRARALFPKPEDRETLAKMYAAFQSHRPTDRKAHP